MEWEPAARLYCSTREGEIMGLSPHSQAECSALHTAIPGEDFCTPLLPGLPRALKDQPFWGFRK